MKHLSWSSFALCSLFLVAVIAALLEAPGAGAALRPPLAAAEEPAPEFREKFRKLMQQNAKAEMTKLVKADPENAVAWIVRTGEDLLEQPSDELKAFLKDLSEAWKTANKSDFGAKIETYYTTLAEDKKKDRTELKRRFEKAHDEYLGNLEDKDGLVFANLVDEIEILAAGFEEVGDHYWAARAWSDYAASYDEELRGAAADLYRAYNGWKRAVDAYDKVDLKDRHYEAALRRKSNLLSKGYDEKKAAPPPPPPGDGPTPPDAGPQAPAANAIRVPMTFEVLPAFDAYQRPSYNSDEIYEIWFGLVFKGKGTSANQPYLEAAPPLLRVGSSEVRFDTNRDGQGDEKLPLTGNIMPVRTTLGSGASARPWAFFAVTGTEKDRYQGIEVNIAPNDTQMTIFVLGASSLVGTVDGTSVRVVDDFIDGVYGTKPQTWAHLGLSPGVFQPELDSIVIGTAKRARPWSEIQEIGGKWYRLAIDAAGTELAATPISPETGVLKLEFKGPAPAWVIVRGMPETQNTFFDLVEGGTRGVSLPVGNYQLYYGEMRKGKKREVQKTLILPARQPETYSVKKGETTLVELGGPYAFDFKHNYVDEKLTVEGQSVVIVGAHGERYERTWNCVPRPEVSWRKKGTKKASKPEKMPPLQDNAGIEQHGWRAAWSPLDLTIEIKGAGDAVEVQLSEKKHEIFGKVESEWKE